jgi:hypothetical protein
LTEILGRIEKIPLDEPSDLMRRSWPDYGRSLEPPRRLLQEVRSPSLVDRFAQGAQYVLSFEAERHAGVSMDGDLTRRYPGFDLDRSWTCPAFVESVFDFTLPALRTEAG